MQYATQRIHLDRIDKDVHPAEVSALVGSFFIVERGEARSKAFESGVEVGDDGREGKGVDEGDASCGVSGSGCREVGVGQRDTTMRLQEKDMSEGEGE